jgi:two-component system phosphate regulon response regulator PhoB
VAADVRESRLVLLVEDHRAFRTLCRLTLEAAGFRVAEAEDGEQALRAVAAERPDVILLDVMMPHVSGWQVAGTLLEDPLSGRIPIIFVTARTAQADRRRAYELGASDYVAKPFDPAVLSEIITKVLDEVDCGERGPDFAESIDTLRAERVLGRDVTDRATH